MTLDPKQTFERSRLFAGFSATGLGILAGIAVKKSLPAGQRLFDESDPGDALYILERGSVRVVARGTDGSELNIATLGPGEHLGALSLLRGGKRMVTAIADSDLEAWRIAQKDFARLQREKPQACLKLMLNIVEDLGQRLDGSAELFREFLSWRLKRQ